jgi:RHS repeat-associated protein
LSTLSFYNSPIQFTYLNLNHRVLKQLLSGLIEFSVDNNQLSGSIPDGFTSLSRLNKFHVQHNLFTSLSSAALSYADDINVSSNKLTFGDLMAQKNVSGITYAPQKVLTDDISEEVLTGASYTITGVDGHTDSYYKWYKNGTLLAEGLEKSYTIDGFSSADEGVYTYEITNANLPDLSLQSGTFTLTVDPNSEGLVPNNVEFAALQDLYESTGGPNWTNNTNWLQGSTAGEMEQWYGISMQDGDVAKIELPNNNLQGPLPESLGDLTSLDTLSLYSNSLTALPESLGNLTNLQVFYAFSNQLSSIPESIGNLSNLYTLRLHSNKLTSIPGSIGNLTKLDVLAVHFNQLSSLPESIGEMTNLEILYIEGNQLTSLPASISSLSKLTTIYAKQNRFSSLPAVLAELPNFNNLYVHENQLTFEAIEQFFTGANTDVFADFRYAPQNAKDPVSVLTEINQAELLDAQDNASHNSFQWQKKVNDVWEDIAGAKASTYETSLASGEAEAFYRCYVTNEWVTDLTLYSPVYHLQVASDLIKNLADNKPTDATPSLPGGTTNKPDEVTEGSEVNYVRTFTPRVPVTDPAAVTINKPAAEIQVATSYADGLGRPIQTVVREESPAGKDIISPVVYDEYGRVSKEYLPYTYNSASPGTFQPNALLQQYNFYHETGDGVADTDYPFAEKVFEPSPLNRVAKQAAPGESWAVGSGKEIKFDWRPNSQALDGAIRLWEVDEAALLPVSPAVYAEGALWVTETTDEDDKKVWEYKDKFRQVVLKKVQLADVPFAPEDYLYTYYVYDDFQRLRFVLQPEGVRELQESGSWTVSSSLKDNYCFAYRYDGRGRMIEKKVPGAAKVEMVYNTRDQLLLSRDGNQREAGEWLFTKYDALNRTILTGMLQDSRNREDMQAAADNDEVVVEARAANNTHLGYTNAAFPVLTLSENTYYLSATYYDDYDFDNDGTADVTYQASGLTPESQPYAYNRGRTTGTKVRVLNTEKNWLSTTTFYDNRGRVIQTQADNHLEGQDILTTVYKNVVNNRVEATRLKHTVNGGSELTIDRRFTYDHANRLLSVHHQINGGEDVILLANEYNELGELVNKQLHKGAADASFHQQLAYSYNIRGWLTGINDAENAADKLFAMNLYYDYGFEQLNYNGNISGVKWKNPLTDEVKAYGYIYDNVNRIRGADYVAGAPGNWSSEADRYDIGNINYDYNGNIGSISRNGLLYEEQGTGDKVYGAFDELGYTYEGNRLKKVDDVAFKGELQGFKDGIQLTEEYLYDANGNMVEDANKQIESIAYNHLNLPKKVHFASGDYIEYDYNAAGTKLQQRVYKDGNLLKWQEYVGELQYIDGSLAFIQHEEGRALPKETGWEYQYHLKDHLGNARLTFTSKPETDEYLATMEGEHALAEESEFLDFRNTRVPVAEPLDHTHLTEEAVGTSPEVVRLNGGRRVYEGPRKSLYLLPGDKVTMRVHVKYLDMTQSELNADVLIAALLGAGGYSIGTENGVSTITNTTTGEQAVLQPGDESKVPLAFLSYAFVDQNYLPVDAGFVQLSTAAAVDPANMKKAHEQLSLEFTATKTGYLDVSLSLGEETKNIDIYYDDFKVTHQHGPIVQADDYMPYGLRMPGLSYQRENVLGNRYLYNGKELQEDLGLEWYDHGARFYDPAVGRFFTQDRFAEKYNNYTPYHNALNNPVMFADYTGDTVELSDAFQNNEDLMKAYVLWSQTDAGSQFLELFDENGEFGEVSIVFDVGDGSDGTKGEVEPLAVNGETGEETRLTGENTIKQLEGEGYDMSEYRSNLKDGEYLRYNFLISPIEAAEDKKEYWIRNRGVTLTHESQHIRLGMFQFSKYKRLVFSAYQEHKIMKSNETLVNQRIGVLRKLRPDLTNGKTNEELKKSVNAFEN